MITTRAMVEGTLGKLKRAVGSRADVWDIDCYAPNGRKLCRIDANGGTPFGRERRTLRDLNDRLDFALYAVEHAKDSERAS